MNTSKDKVNTQAESPGTVLFANINIAFGTERIKAEFIGWSLTSAFYSLRSLASHLF